MLELNPGTAGISYRSPRIWKLDLTLIYARAYIVVEFRRQDDVMGKVQLTLAQAGRVALSPLGPDMAEMRASFLAAMNPVAAAPFWASYLISSIHAQRKHGGLMGA